MRSEGCRPLGGSLPMSLSTALEVSPYIHLGMDVSGFPSLDNIGDKDPNNYILS